MLTHFRFNKYEFTLSFSEGCTLPEYKGSTLRGAFGHAFRGCLCSQKQQVCDSCLLRESCIYSILFETPPSLVSGRLTRYERAPHPYVIEPPADKKRHYKEGDTLDFSMVLIGRALDHLPYFVQAWIHAGEKGLGTEGGTFALTRVRCGFETVYEKGTNSIRQVSASHISCENSPATSLHLKLLTPTRIPFQGKPLRNELPFRPFFSVLLRRISMLSSYHCAKDLDLDFSGLLKMAENLRIKEQDLRFWDWQRKSNRQNKTIPMGGLAGDICWAGDLSVFLPFIALGEQIHVGKGAVMGMGHYKMEVK